MTYFPMVSTNIPGTEKPYGPMSMKAARRKGYRAALRGPHINPYPLSSCAAQAWMTGYRLGEQRPRYQVHLIVDGDVIDAGYTLNCKHAVRAAFECLAGIPQAEVTIRHNGRMVVWMHTNFYGDIDEIEAHFRRDGVVLPLNPKWERWPKFANTPHGDVKKALKNA